MSGKGEIAVGLYLPSTGERLTLAGDHIGQNAYRTASITFTPQHESSFVVYEDGWHGAEFQRNSQASWRWDYRPRGGLVPESQGRRSPDA